MKRVLLTVHKFFPHHKAGTELLTLKVAQELKHRGYETLVLTANPPDLDARFKGGPETSEYEYEGIRVKVVEEALRLKDNTFSTEYYNPTIREHFKSIVTDFAPDMVHIFHAQNLSSSIIDESLEQRLPVVYSATDFWFICPVVQLKRPDGTICRGPAPLAANCLTCYTPALFPPVEEFSSALEKRFPIYQTTQRLSAPLSNFVGDAAYAIYKASKLPAAVGATVNRPNVLRTAANKVSAITVPTALMRELFVENGINSNLIHHVPFGIDTAPLEACRTKSKSEHLRIGFIGTLFEHKGVDVLIKAFLTLPEEKQACLRIYGDAKQFPDYSTSLKKLASNGSENSSRISFEGTFPNDQLGPVLSNLDVLVVPSRWYENTPLVIQSALASKTPVVATNLGGMSELIHHGVNGLLFELNNSDSLAQQLLRLVSEPALLPKLISGIKPERTTQQMVDQLESIYAQVR
jgi:glycosyltransferase involved in cell wall biosynthesis